MNRKEFINTKAGDLLRNGHDFYIVTELGPYFAYLYNIDSSKLRTHRYEDVIKFDNYSLKDVKRHDIRKFKEKAKEAMERDQRVLKKALEKFIKNNRNDICEE